MPTVPSPPAVSVVVVSHESGPHLGRCLDALRGQTMTEFEALVVDCASADRAAVAAAMPADPRFRLIALDDNIGFAAANNLAARQATAPWLALLNPDAFPALDWLDRLLAATRRHAAAAFGSTQLSDADPSRLDGAGDACHVLGFPWRMGRGMPVDRLPPGDRPVLAVCAAAALYERAAFLAVGGFDETFFCFLEDIDLGFRLRGMGREAIQVDDATVHHVGGGSGGGASPFARYHGTRNMIWAMAKNMPAPLLAVALPIHLAISTTVALGALLGGRGAARLRGLGDGLAGLPAALARRGAVPDLGEVARLLTWSPGPWLRRDIVALRTARPPAATALEGGHG